jgi:hypothetical protein
MKRSVASAGRWYGRSHFAKEHVSDMVDKMW